MQTVRSYEKFNLKVGDVLGSLTFTGNTYFKEVGGYNRRIVEATCECGSTKEYLYKRLKNGETKSCGCLRTRKAKAVLFEHNHSKSLLYYVYNEMKQRCSNPNNPSYRNYGARGITVCQEWLESFQSFHDWSLANGYEKGLTLDRRENDGNYGPDNCRYVLRDVQCRNTRKNKFYTAFGVTKCLFDWGRDPRCIVGMWCLRNRMDRYGWTDIEKAMTTPLLDRKESARNSTRSIQLTAFGETKCMTEWLEDSRCLVKLDSLRDRVRKKWDHEKAISTPPVEPKIRNVSKFGQKMITAFGETKTAKEWIVDDRCVVEEQMLKDRLKKRWHPEDALSTIRLRKR